MIVVCSRPWGHIPEEERTLLTRILGSVRLTPDAVSIRHLPVVSVESLRTFSPGKVLIFGSAIQPDIPTYENNFISGVAVVKADDLSQLDDSRKKSLWIALKQMFGV